MPKRAPVRASGAVVTIREVARLAGVSTATVSRVFSGGTAVREDLKERVRQAAATLSYRPNRLARNLRIRKTQAIGVIVPDIENPFFTSIIRGIEEVLRSADYSLLLANSDENQVREKRNVEALHAEAIAGMIFAPSGPDAALYEGLAVAGLPLVAVSRMVPGLDVDSVTVADRDGAKQAVAHLIELGHTRIGLISGPPWISTARDRIRGYEQALAAAGLPRDAALIQYADYRQAGGHEAMNALLAAPNPPTAVFAGSNLMTLGALQAIHERSIRVPDDLAVLGFDDMPWAASLQPPLTAVAQPAFEVGVNAARLLLERIANPRAATRRVVLKTKLVVRASTGPRAAVAAGTQG